MELRLTQLRLHLSVFFNLLLADLMSRHGLLTWSKVFDVCISTVLPSLGFTYILPKMGIPMHFVVIVMVGSIAARSFEGILGTVVTFAASIRGSNTKAYQFLLPIPSWLVLFKEAAVHAVSYFMLSILVLPLLKIIMLGSLDLTALSLWRLMAALAVVNFFCGFFALWCMSIVGHPGEIMKVFYRFIYPLSYFGSRYFTWTAFSSISFSLGLIALLNPFLHCTEMARVAVLGQQKFVPFWWSVLALLTLSIVFGWWGTVRLRRKLDFV